MTLKCELILYRTPPLDRVWAHGGATGPRAVDCGTWVRVGMTPDAPSEAMIDAHAGLVAALCLAATTLIWSDIG